MRFAILCLIAGLWLWYATVWMLGQRIAHDWAYRWPWLRPHADAIQTVVNYTAWGWPVLLVATLCGLAAIAIRHWLRLGSARGRG